MVFDTICVIGGSVACLVDIEIKTVAISCLACDLIRIDKIYVTKVNNYTNKKEINLVVVDGTEHWNRTKVLI